MHKSDTMMRKTLRNLTAMAILLCPLPCPAQDTLRARLSYDPEAHKIIPDKVFEIGIPALLLLLLLNTIVAILKNRSDAQLKQQLIERGASDETLIAIFSESSALARLQPLKYALHGGALALAFITIHLFGRFMIGSGYLAVGTVLLFASAASGVYYLILRRRR